VEKHYFDERGRVSVEERPKAAHQGYPSKYALGKRISEFGERLAVSPLEQIDKAIVEGLNHIVELVDTDRICWYEVEGSSGALQHKYTGCVRQAPMSPKTVPPGKMPTLAERLARHEIVALERLQDLPHHGVEDKKFLQQLGVKSLLLIPSSYSPRRKGVLGVASYSKEVSWDDESISQLAIVANIVGAILERRDAQVAQQESEERFLSVFVQAPIGIALETLEGRILEVNPAFCAMLGYTPEELRSSTCARLSHPDDEEREMVLFEELRQQLRTSYRMQKRFFRKDGSQMWGHVNVSLLVRNLGNPPLVIGMVSDITAQKSAEAALYQRDQELQRLAGHLIRAQEEERHRISRELHDDIGQRISLLAFELDAHGRRSSTHRHEKQADLLEKMRSELKAIASDIHELSHELHSSGLRCCQLGIALRDLCSKYANNHRLEIDLQTEGLDSNLSSDVALCLFRVVQEGLANVVKHGGTTKAVVKVTQDSEKVRLIVRDFGTGFDLLTQSGGIGLVGMRERLRLCGGSLSVNSAPMQGTEITAEIVTRKTLEASAD
jgi:PAS domain S-box-containing protein